MELGLSKVRDKKKISYGNYAKKIGRLLNYLLLPLIIFALWWYAGEAKWFPEALLPTIPNVTNTFVQLIKSGQLQSDIFVSLTRVIKGFLLASFLGITLGILMGASSRINRFFVGTLNSIRQIPLMAWIPLIILWFGIDEASKIVIIVMGAFFPVLVNTISGIRQVPQGFIEVGKMFKLSKWELFRKVYFPSAIPSIFVGLKLSLGVSWMVVVAAELIASTSGIGYRINDARSLMQPEVVIVGMLVIGIIGIIMDQILAMISRKITPWATRK